MPDSHLMLSAMEITFEIRRNNDPGEAAAKAAESIPEHLGTLWRLRKRADCVQGGTTKGIRP